MSKEASIPRRVVLERVATALAVAGTGYVEWKYRPFRTAVRLATRELWENTSAESNHDYFGKELGLPDLCRQITAEIEAGATVVSAEKYTPALVSQALLLLGQDRNTSERRAVATKFADIPYAGQVSRDSAGEPLVTLHNYLKTPTPGASDEQRIAQWVEFIDVSAHEVVHAAPFVIRNSPVVEDYGVLGRFINTAAPRSGFSMDGTYDGSVSLFAVPKSPNFLEEFVAEVGRVALMRRFHANGLNIITDAQTVMGSHLQCRCHAFLAPALNWAYEMDLLNTNKPAQFTQYALGNHLVGNRAEFLYGVGAGILSDSSRAIAEGNIRAAGLVYMTARIAEGFGFNYVHTITSDSLTDSTRLFNLAQDLHTRIYALYNP